MASIDKENRDEAMQTRISELEAKLVSLQGTYYNFYRKLTIF